MGAPAFVSAWLAYAYGASGDRDRALAEVEDLTNMSLNGLSLRSTTRSLPSVWVNTAGR